jgi:Fic family protein
MSTLAQWLRRTPDIPAAAAWMVADIEHFRGRQDLYLKQAPQVLKALREHALVESAVSSNRIEGVEVLRGRVRAIVLGKGLLKERNEEEVRGYREALDWVHRQGGRKGLDRAAILTLHRLSHAGAHDAGKFRAGPSDVIEHSPDGRRRVRFHPPEAGRVPGLMDALVKDWKEARAEGAVHPLILLAGFNLDFLCVHPFRDGNGRVSRLLLLRQLYALGYEAGRYVSVERLIEENKARYYETLEAASKGWHEGRHDPWPYATFLLYIVKSAFKEFEARAGSLKSPRGEKSAHLLQAMLNFRGPFSVADLQRACPHASVPLIRFLLKRERDAGRAECLGRGPKARWRVIRK